MSTPSTVRTWARRIAIAMVSLLGFALSAHGATLLPNGEQQFVDGNGVPLAGGSVYMYTPSTTNCKTTWKDAGQTMANTCPIQLDAAGRAIIYGAGVYRQQVWACSTPPTQCDNTDGILQWDQLTTDTSASNSVFWAGNAGGTANVITLTDAGFNGTDGSILAFIPTITNTGATTINPSGFGAISVVQDTTSGAEPLVGGEFVANSPSNVAEVLYSASQNNFHILNLLVKTTAAPGVVPQGYLNSVGVAGGGPVQGTTDVIAATTIYYDPYNGNQVPIWNGVAYSILTFSELSLALSGSSQLGSTSYDVCIFNHLGNATAVFGPAWSVSTAGSGARGTGPGTAQLIQNNGLLVNEFQITGNNGVTSYTIPALECTYVGSVLIDATAGQVTTHRTYGQARKFGVWNYYNRLPIVLQMGDPSTSWVYSTNTWRESHGATADNILIFTGMPEEVATISFVQVTGWAMATNENISSASFTNGIGLNSTTAPTGQQGSASSSFDYSAGVSNTQGTSNYTLTARYVLQPSLGLNVVNSLETATVGTEASVTWLGQVSGMILAVEYRG